MELGTTVQTNDQKGLKAFHQLKTLEKGSVIKGVHQGRFESKKTPGYFFHVFKDVDGEASAYGTCSALDDRIKEINEKQSQMGRKLYAEISFNGRIPSKKNPKMTFYSFSTQKLVEVLGPEGDLNTTDGAATTGAVNPVVTTDEIPF